MLRFLVGVDDVEGPPVPIPNTVVKLNSAENTWLEAARENRSTPTLFLFNHPRGWLFFCKFLSFFEKTFEKNEKTAVITAVLLLCRHRLIFPGRFQPSIVSTDELNYRVRDGNGWTLIAKNTDLRLRFVTHSSESVRLLYTNEKLLSIPFFKFFYIFSDFFLGTRKQGDFCAVCM